MSSYGTYLSAAAMMHNSHRIDLISNNLANVETGGFKRALATIAERRPADATDRRPENALGGGPWLGPTQLDLSQGAFEPTGNPLDVALIGPGFLATVDDDGEDLKLTRDGGLHLDTAGFVVTNNQFPRRVLDADGNSINLFGIPAESMQVTKNGTILDRNGLPLAQLGFFDPPDPAALRPVGGNLFSGVDDFEDLAASAESEVRGGFIERANVDPTVELTRMLDAQRQLEANARMIQQQDEATDKLVNVVGKVT